MTEETIERLKAHFSCSCEPDLLQGKPASDVAIAEAQRGLNCRFDPDYITFLRTFGCGMVGADPVFGIGTAGAMGKGRDVVSVTEHFRAQRWPGVEDWYVISADGRGNPIGIGPDGKVRLSDHDVGDVPVIAEGFEAFILSRLTASDCEDAE